MSTERRKQKAAEWAAEQERMDAERRRRASLSMWERIEEFGGDEEMKSILHELAEKTGLEG